MFYDRWGIDGYRVTVDNGLLPKSAVRWTYRNCAQGLGNGAWGQGIVDRGAFSGVCIILERVDRGLGL